MTMTMTVIQSSVLLVCMCITNYYYVKSNHVKYQVKKENNTLLLNLVHIFCL